MRASLLYNPFDLIDRLAIAIRRRRRRQVLAGTPASTLTLGHLDSLELLQLLRAQPPAVIYDIGANVGTWTRLAKSLYPAARVEAFEPLSMHRPGFDEQVAPWAADVRLHACALGATEHEAAINVMDFSDASSLLPVSDTGRAEFKVAPVRVETVPVVPLDVLIAREKLPPPDLLKLDVQGYELEVFRGAEGALRHARAVICEVSFRTFYEGQPLFPDLVAFLGRHGYVVHALGAGTALGEPLVQADVLFLRPPA